MTKSQTRVPGIRSDTPGAPPAVSPARAATPRARATPPEPTGELRLIEEIRRRAAALPRHPAVALGIGDDCAILRPKPGDELLVTTDFSLEGRHFRRDWHPARAIGHRTLARGLSDLAAMGAQPAAAFLSLALPRAVARDRRWITGFLDGLLQLAQTTGTPLAGGDTSESPDDAVLVDIVLMGTAPRGSALRRSGARAGDRLFVTGALGGAAAQLEQIARTGSRGARARALPGASPHLYPAPRLAVGQTLRRRGLATAAIDLSDGLSTDLAHLCAASHLGAELQLGRLPLHPSATRGRTPAAALSLALHGGEDYELLFTASPAARVPRSLAGVRITEIGRMVHPPPTPNPPVTAIDAGGARTALAPGGWEHLR